jgi:hypothetical protein
VPGEYTPGIVGEYRLVLEIVFEILGDRHCEESDEFVYLRLTEFVEFLQEISEFESIARLE